MPLGCKDTGIKMLLAKNKMIKTGKQKTCVHLIKNERDKYLSLSNDLKIYATVGIFQVYRVPLCESDIGYRCVNRI